MINKTDVKPLLERLCIGFGFCLPPAENEKLCVNPPATVLEFTNAVFSAEGLAPEGADLHLFRQVRDSVAQAFRLSEERQEILVHTQSSVSQRSSKPPSK